DIGGDWPCRKQDTRDGNGHRRPPVRSRQFELGIGLGRSSSDAEAGAPRRGGISMTAQTSLAPAQTYIDRAIPAGWRVPLFLLLCAWTGLSLFFASDWAGMARQWWDSSTYNHILLIPPVLVWLVWLRKGELTQLSPRPWWPGLVLLLAALFVWL